MKHMEFFLGKSESIFENCKKDWCAHHGTQRLWNADATLWTNSDESQWCGWLQLDELYSDIPYIITLQQDLVRDIDAIVLLGMGGSSLFAKTIANDFSKDKSRKSPRLIIIDTLASDYIKTIESNINLKQTLFIVASKSGTTLETNYLYQYFYQQLKNSLVSTEAIGAHFIAITDANSPLAILAEREKFKGIFFGKVNIGGRYSALSLFGTLPMSLSGIDPQRFFLPAKEMQTACHSIHVDENPGVLLGLLLGAAALENKNKLTFLLDPAIQHFAFWLEQLIAESTGKNGKGFVPIINEPLLENAHAYHEDRIFIYMYVKERDEVLYQQLLKLKALNHPIIMIRLKDQYSLGAEVFRFEIATCVAASILRVNPFDQPNVESGKVLTKQLLTNPISLDTDVIVATASFSIFIPKSSTPVSGKILLTDLINNTYDFFAINAFLSPNELNTALLQKIRLLLQQHLQIASLLNFGPQFLHSTAQLFRGGPNTGMFLQFTTDSEEEINVNGTTFTALMQAQANGDFLEMRDLKRKVIRVHLTTNVTRALSDVYNYLQNIFAT